MGTTSADDIDAWLRDGGLVVTASERAARSLTSAFHRARRAESLAAWPAPNIQDWQTFVRRSFDQRIFDDRFVLNPMQEQSLWAGVIAAAAPQAAQLIGARDRLACLAIEAHGLLCAYTPRLLNRTARTGWDQDAAAFSAWLAAFDQLCRDNKLIGAARLPLELTDALQADSASRPPLLLAGFDRILPTQRALFNAWGTCNQAPVRESAPRVQFHQASDPAAELAACALWCKRCLAANPNARLLIVTQDAANRRGEIERAFLRFTAAAPSASSPTRLFEFSLGIPLGQIGLARSASLLLHWLNGPIQEHELDWLLSSGYSAISPQESRALTSYMRFLRHRGLQRTSWKLAEFISQHTREKPPTAWVARLTQAQRRLHDVAQRSHPPLAWAELVPQLLEDVGWPGARPLGSSEFQAHRRWQQSVDDCASLGFDGRRIPWKDFLAALDRAVSETLFTPESEDAPILIAGAAESAGLSADAIWFLGANEDAWPAPGATHPLLPIAVQRQAGMPHATAQLDWDLAAAITRRLLASALDVHFSYARQSDGVESRPSRLIMQIAAPSQPLPPELVAPTLPEPLAVPFHDATQLPFPPRDVTGGSSVLTAQSQCPFKAFATSRLGAQTWDPAEAGLSASERGQLLHAVLRSIWAGSPNGIRTHAELVAIADRLSAFVQDHVRRVLQQEMPARARQSMPQQYLLLEETRLTNLVTEWLRYESARLPFTVVDAEKKTDTFIAGLPLHLRLDRIDRLNDGSLLVIDYKSGDVSPGSWDLPRPDDVQLPLYAGFALKPSETLGGLVFAKIRAGEGNREFAGRVRNAPATLLSDLGARNPLVNNPLTNDDIDAWRSHIEQLAQDFLSGRAPVDPREYPKTCARCGLQALCRIQERPLQPEDDEGSETEEAADA